MSPELVGFRELPDLLGVSRATAGRYLNRPDFPEPAERLASGRIWRREDVEAWAQANLPIPTGRPPRRVTFLVERRPQHLALREAELLYGYVGLERKFADVELRRQLGRAIRAAKGESDEAETVDLPAEMRGPLVAAIAAIAKDQALTGGLRDLQMALLGERRED